MLFTFCAFGLPFGWLFISIFLPGQVGASHTRTLGHSHTHWHNNLNFRLALREFRRYWLLAAAFYLRFIFLSRSEEVDISVAYFSGRCFWSRLVNATTSIRTQPHILAKSHTHTHLLGGISDSFEFWEKRDALDSFLKRLDGRPITATKQHKYRTWTDMEIRYFNQPKEALASRPTSLGRSRFKSTGSCSAKRACDELIERAAKILGSGRMAFACVGAKSPKRN